MKVTNISMREVAIDYAIKAMPGCTPKEIIDCARAFEEYLFRNEPNDFKKILERIGGPRGAVAND